MRSRKTYSKGRKSRCRGHSSYKKRKKAMLRKEHRMVANESLQGLAVAFDRQVRTLVRDYAEARKEGNMLRAVGILLLLKVYGLEMSMDEADEFGGADPT